MHFFLLDYHALISTCGFWLRWLRCLPTRAASRRQCHLEGLSPHDMDSYSNNQLLWREGHLSAHSSTSARMLLWNFRWVGLEPSSCRLEPSDRTSRNCLKTISARSKPVLAMELSSWPDSGQTRSLQRCLSSPVPRPKICSTLEPGPKSWWNYSPGNSSCQIVSSREGKVHLETSWNIEDVDDDKKW